MRAVRDIIYRCNLTSQHSDVSVAKRVNESHKDKMTREREKLDAKGKLDSNAIMSRLFLAHIRKHFGGDHRDGDEPTTSHSFFSVHGAWLKRHSLSSVASFLQEPLCKVTCTTLGSDVDDFRGIEAAIDGVASPDGEVYFKVVHMRPSKFHLVSVASASGRKIPDQFISITLHQCVGCDDGQPLVDTAPCEHGSISTVLLLGTDGLASSGIKTWRHSSAAACDARHILPAPANEIASQLVPNMVLSSAVPGSSKVYLVPARGDEWEVLEQLREPKTTLMLRNLGAEATSEMLVEELRLFGMEGRVDFVHAWVDFKSKLCTGDAYLNFFDPADARVLKEMWHGREELGGIPCRQRWQRRAALSVAFARKQGFDLCVVESRRKHWKDPNRMGWVHSSKEALVRELEKNLGPPPGLSPPPGLAAPQKRRRGP